MVTIGQILDACPTFKPGRLVPKRVFDKTIKPFRDALEEALIEREQALVERLLGVGTFQFGVEPAFAMEVFAEVGLGRPLDNETRALIHRSFIAKMNEYREAAGMPPIEEGP
jgi:hypothetical protein